jgi:hypothetical protein
VTLPALAQAEDAAFAPAVVWYRGSEQCPGAADFLGRLGAKAPNAKLAEAGDHVDFVVTLLAARGETVGRLERQTEGGIVAIRELRDVSCDRVADALALSLGLTLEGRRAAPATEEAPSVAAASLPARENAPASPDLSAPVVVEPAPQSVAAPSVPTSPPDDDSSAPENLKRTARGVRHGAVGASGGVLYGMAPDPEARVHGFVEFHDVLPSWLRDASLRFGVVGAYGASATPVGDVSRWLVAARGELCPVWWRIASFAAGPCATLELGASGAAGTGRSGIGNVGPWVAPGASARAAVGGALRAEIEAGLGVPLIRSEIDSGSVALYREQPVAFAAAIGLSYRIW